MHIENFITQSYHIVNHHNVNKWLSAQLLLSSRMYGWMGGKGYRLWLEGYVMVDCGGKDVWWWEGYVVVADCGGRDV